MATDRRACVVGATGLVGGHLLGKLVARPAYRAITTLGRRAPDVADARLAHRVVDFAAPDYGDALAVDTLFCCLGTTIRRAGSREAFRHVDLEIVVDVASRALAAGATCLVVVSSIGADPRSRNFYQRTKGEMEQAVAALGYPRVAVVRPSLLIGERDERRPIEAISQVASRFVDPLLLGPLARYRSIGADAVADAMIALDLAAFSGVRIVESDELAALAAA